MHNESPQTYIEVAVGVEELLEIDYECLNATEFRNYTVNKPIESIKDNWKNTENESGNKRVVFFLRKKEGDSSKTIAMIAGELIKGDDEKFEELIIFNIAVKPEHRNGRVFSEFASNSISAILDIQQESTEAATQISEGQTPIECSDETKKMLGGISHITASRSSGLKSTDITKETQRTIREFFSNRSSTDSGSSTEPDFKDQLNELISEINKAGILIDGDGKNYRLNSEKISADKKDVCESLFSEISASFKARYENEDPANSVGASFPISIAKTMIVKQSDGSGNPEGARKEIPQIRLFLGDTSGEFGFQIKFNCDERLKEAIAEKITKNNPRSPSATAAIATCGLSPSSKASMPQP